MYKGLKALAGLLFIGQGIFYLLVHLISWNAASQELATLLLEPGILASLAGVALGICLLAAPRKRSVLLFLLVTAALEAWRGVYVMVHQNAAAGILILLISAALVFMNFLERRRALRHLWFVPALLCAGELVDAFGWGFSSWQNTCLSLHGIFIVLGMLMLGASCDLYWDRDLPR